MIGPSLRLVRDGPLASMASVGGVQRARTIPMWPLVAGVGAGGRRRRVESIRARVAAAERGHQRERCCAAVVLHGGSPAALRWRSGC